MNSNLQRKIILRGIVEGIGMRPALFRLAGRFGLHGHVINCAGWVELLLQGPCEDVERCFKCMPEALPPGARLEMPLEFEDSAIERTAGEFRILVDDSGSGVNLLTPSDLAMCPRCRAEMNDPADRRYHYPFNSCGECGPRASVIRSLPYERANTAWRAFPLCEKCRREYDDPADRRFHIEGISCPECGPRLAPSLEELLSVLEAGGIAALKGVGGFQLLADPRNADAVARLRGFKKRPEKPLALMARSLETVKKYCKLTPLQEELISSPAAPIVLCTWTAEPLELINPDNPQEIGIMLPSSPLHELLMNSFSGDLLVVTSGNRFSEPPALSGKEAALHLQGVDCILDHNRDIYWRHDDSVAVENHRQVQYWRCGRGCRWSALDLKPGFERNVLALGGALKNTFAMAGKDYLLTSPHHGELEDADVAVGWEKALNQTLSQLSTTPDAVAVDLHPDYYSTRYGERLAAKLGVPCVRVPHHYAHALAGLLESDRENALALVFDGNGLGPDGKLWGAELLYVSREGGRRLATWEAVPLPGGELAIREPWRQLAGRLYAAGLDTDPEITLQCRKNLNAPFSHAAGRLFDAFAALAGAAPRRISYEGQGAIRLETQARREKDWDGVLYPWSSSERGGVLYVDWSPLLREKVKSASPALSFHRSVAAAALEMVEFGLACQQDCDTVILTGGVFQNRLLTGLTAGLLEGRGLKVFIPGRVPPNDAGISVGQCLWAGLNFRISGVHYLI